MTVPKIGDTVWHNLSNVRGEIVESPNPTFCLNIEWADGFIGGVHPDDLKPLPSDEGNWVL